MIELLSLPSSEVARYIAFLNKHDEEKPGCHMWTGAVAKGGGGRNRRWNAPGYGIFQSTTLRPKTRRAHILAYQMWVGPVPAGFQVQHRCNNTLCCNPSHLILGTARQNSAYMVECGRAATGLRHGLAKLGVEQITEIYRLCCEKLGEKPKSHAKGNEAAYRQIAEKFGVSYSHVRNIHRGRRRPWNLKPAKNSEPEPPKP